MSNALTFAALRAANLDRLPQFRNAQGAAAHDQADGSDWSINDWFTAVAGEAGELGNLLKKIRRGDFTLEAAREKVAGELADVVIYLDILAFRCGVDLGEAITATFNAKSEQVGATTRLRDVVMPAYQAIGPAGAYGLVLMRRILDEAAAAMAAGDVIAMIRALEDLRGYKA